MAAAVALSWPATEGPMMRAITSAKVIFSAEYLGVVFIITVLCSIWIHHACKDVLVRFDYAVETTKQLLKNSYRNVLIEDEIDQHTSATFVANSKHLRQQVGGYRRLWYSVSAVLLFTFVVGYVTNYGLPHGNGLKPVADGSLSTSVPAPALPTKGKKAEHPRGAVTSAPTPAPASTPAPPEPKPDKRNALNKPH